MAQPEHRTREHREARALFGAWVATGTATCTEPVCLEENDGRGRRIDPDTEWDAAHDARDPERRTYLGPAHARCNRAAGGRAAQANRRAEDAANRLDRVVIASRDW